MTNRPPQPRLLLSDKAVFRLREFFRLVLKARENEPVDEWLAVHNKAVKARLKAEPVRNPDIVLSKR